MNRVDLWHPQPPAVWRPEILRLLSATNEEFTPPLSTREGTTAASLRGSVETSVAPETYVDGVMTQSMLAATDGQSLLGLLSFIPSRELPLLEGWPMPCVYISTVAVDPTKRRRGLARQLYGTLLQGLPSDIASPTLATRTWSGNRSHLSLLDELGFSVALRLTDDRGEGVDTIYLARLFRTVSVSNL